MKKDKIVISDEESLVYDKFTIALAIRNSTYEDEMSCSLLEEEVIKDCSGCSLNYICNKIDEVAEDYEEKTTKVINTFSFKE
ncbi:hypothetical protein [Clostridium fungisolvens]|uniref:Uncharacterized protein n=1 Tax=Clostridium fungisolvens TaxID=1604897 RepID=A0A6V8SGR4_9CLOT|nr:hypothetical protein [Clostridium fungisolvens]GFP76404.1 hypothetical protein bsdtw1_02506 [Clostridium fungisolvens]